MGGQVGQCQPHPRLRGTAASAGAQRDGGAGGVPVSQLSGLAEAVLSP